MKYSDNQSFVYYLKIADIRRWDWYLYWELYKIYEEDSMFRQRCIPWFEYKEWTL